MTSNIGSENNIHANHLNIFIFLSSLLLSSINSKLEGITSNLSTTGNVTFSSTYFPDSTPIKIYKNSYFAYLSFDKSDLSINFASEWNPDIGIVIPIGFRPKEDICLPIVLYGSDSRHTPGIASITSNGKIILFGHSGTITRIMFKGRWSI